MRRMSTRTFVVIGLLVTVLVAGVVSYWASSHPDGLEHVAERVGFADTAEDSPTAGSPLSDYQVEGVDDPALSGGLAGVIGSVVVLVLAGGLGYAVRRRGSGAGDDEELTAAAGEGAGEGAGQGAGQEAGRGADRG